MSTKRVCLREKKQIKLDSAVYVFYLDDAFEVPKYDNLRYIPFFL